MKIVRQFLLRSEKSQNLEPIKELLRWNHGNSFQLEDCVVQYFAKNSPFLDELVQERLLFGGKPFERNAQGIMPFAEALKQGTPNSLQYLISRPDCNLAMDVGNGATPLLSAITGGNREKIQMLLKAQAPLPVSMTKEQLNKINDFYSKHPADLSEDRKDLLKTSRSSDLDSYILNDMLHSKASIDVIHDLKEAGCFGSIVDNETNRKVLEEMIVAHVNELTDSSEGKLVDLLKWMIEQRNEVLNEPLKQSVRTKKTTLFNEIVLSGHHGLIDYGLAHGAKLESIGSGYPSPLEYIAVNSYQDPERKIYQKLVEAGADQNAAGGLTVASPFTLIVAEEASIVDWALAHGASLNPPNPKGLRTPLQQAVIEDNPSLLKKLVMAGADLKAPGNSKVPAPFISIIDKGDVELIKWCIEHGADPSLNYQGNNTPLQAAAKFTDSKWDIFKLLLENGAKINDVGLTGDPPIVYIIAKGNVENVEYCIQKGARLETPEVQKKALQKAIWLNDPKMVQYLFVNRIVDPQLFNQDVMLETLKKGIEGYELHKDSQTVKNMVQIFTDRFETLFKQIQV